MMYCGDAIDRFVTAGFDVWKVSLKIAETMAASQTVIAARMTMLGNGFEHPGRMPFLEFSRLVPEKTAAFGKANEGAARALRTGTPKAATPDAMVLLDWWETSIKATAAWWTPVHAQAMANARRLS